MRPKFSNSKHRFAACFYLHEKEILVLIVPVIGHYRLKNKNVFFYVSYGRRRTKCKSANKEKNLTL